MRQVQIDELVEETGFAISRAIVEAHGGRIWIVDEPHDDADAGARVRVSLPGAPPAPLAA